jgi:translation initiation factor IF-3
MQFKGREIVHIDLGLEKLKEFATRLEDISKVEESPKRQGRGLTMILAPKK